MIKLYNFDELKPEEILNRDIRAEKNVEDVVDAIIADVRARGDDALKDYALKFDGATIVKDLNDIKGLDLKAMLHDYECLMGANSNYRLWYVSAYDYYLNHFKLGNGNQILRFLGLCVLGIFFVPYCKIKLIYL